MEQQVFLLLLVMLSAVQGWTTTFCSGEPCPEYHVVKDYGEFEEREYVRTRWITTKIQSSSYIHLMAALQTLRSYSEGHNKAGAMVPKNTWPVLVTVTVGEDGSERDVFLSWFVSDDTELPEPNDPSIIEEVRPAATVYVRMFSDRVTRNNAKDNTEKLHEALVKAEISFDHHRSSGAGYNSFWDVHQHNEVWMYGVTA